MVMSGVGEDDTKGRHDPLTTDIFMISKDLGYI